MRSFHPKHSFARLKLREQILLGYSVPIALSLLSATLVYVRGVRDVERQVVQVNVVYQNVGDVQNLAYIISAMQRAARGYLLGRNQTELSEYETLDTEFYEQSERLRAYIRDPQQQANLNQIIEVGDRVNAFNRRLISYLELNKRQKMLESWNRGEVQVLAQDLRQRVENFERIERQKLQAQQQQQVNALRSLTGIVFGLAAVSGVGAIVAGVTISRAIARKMTRETGAIASSSAEIAVTMEQQERANSEQASSVNQTTATIDELNSSFRQVAEQAEASAHQARHALQLSERGTKAVDRTLYGMDELKHKVDAIAERNRHLNEQSAQIDTIARSVGELAAQTGMLALNAAIEAVRAGDTGKGFGVVASEIRRLATQSHEAAQNINALVLEIQQAMKQTVTATEEGTQTVDASIEIAREMTNAFTGVADAVNTVVTNNQQMSLNSKQQLNALEQVVEAMNEIDRAAKENANGISQVKLGTERLDRALQNLKGIV
jgi:methyl-accepting chemotaxis protein